MMVVAWAELMCSVQTADFLWALFALWVGGDGNVWWVRMGKDL